MGEEIPTDADPPSTPDSPIAPSTGEKKIGPYEILEEIGRGGMGVVYKAFQPQLKRTVALKVLIAGEDASEDAITRFHREAEAVAKLGHHPNIVPVYDIGTTGKVHYFAMHFVEGKPLDRMIDERDITPKRAAVITKQLAEALHHAHEHGVLHRDVKPSNVLMASEGGQRSAVRGETQEEDFHTAHRSPPTAEFAPMLTDFGLAKDVESESTMTRSGMTLGTPNYMPPEQARGSIAEIDERSDVYSLGATLFEMLTLEPPFVGANVMEVIQKVMFREPVPPRKRNPTVARDLETICLKCLEKDIQRRFASAQELAEDLGRFLEGMTIRAKPASLAERTMRRLRRHKIAVLAAAVVALVLLLGGIPLVLWMARERERAEGERAKEAARAVQAAKGEEEAQRLLQKNSRVADVLLSAYTRLGWVNTKRKKDFYDFRLPGERDEELTRRTEREIEAFASGIRPDPASQATLLAVKGWLAHLARQDDRAAKLFKEARERDEEVVWGYMFEAMVWLSLYVWKKQLPETRARMQGLTFEEVIPDSDELVEFRRRFLALLGELSRQKAWGREMIDLKEVLHGFMELGEGRLEEAEKGLTS
ncbi:MAG: serine/threonine-protein kinase, partial [Planctomycetota bacterium]